MVKEVLRIVPEMLDEIAHEIHIGWVKQYLNRLLKVGGFGWRDAFVGGQRVLLVIV